MGRGAQAARSSLADRLRHAFLHRERPLQLEAVQLTSTGKCSSSRQRWLGEAHKSGERHCGKNPHLTPFPNSPYTYTDTGHRLHQRFVASLLDLSTDAPVIVAGDMNEFTAARSVLRPLAALLHDANDVAGVPAAERYTYAYDQHAQEIDQVFVSDAIARRGGDVEHVHVNTWAKTVGERASDHDPTVVRLWVCDAETGMLVCGSHGMGLMCSLCTCRCYPFRRRVRNPSWPNGLELVDQE